MTVILADDEYPALCMLKHYIDWKGLGLTLLGCAETGAELMDLIAVHPPDIVITDIRMPNQSGLDVIQQTQAMNLSTTFIITSAYANFEYARTAMNLGVKDFLPKPLDRRELNQTLQKVVAQLAKSELDDTQSQIIRKAKTYIREHFADKLSLEIVAAGIFVSPTYLSAKFKKDAGVNFSDYVTQVRIAEAKRMLREGGMSIQEIAVATGYRDPNYMSRVFRDIVGCSPSAYRNNEG